MITNTNATRHSNFIISSEGYLSVLSNQDRTLLHYDPNKLIDTGAQTITYWTKDLDFGFPSQTKKLFKVYITYKGDGSSLKVLYGVDGHDTTYSEEADLYQFNSTNTPLQDYNDNDGSGEDAIENWHVAELKPTTASEGKGWKSISIYMNGSVDSTFEIQDISILYRVRPIK